MTDTARLTLTDFLLARIAEDEEIARAVPGPFWERAIERDGQPGRWGGIRAELVTLPAVHEYVKFSDEVAPELARSRAKPVADYIAHHDPARVLAECKAKRQIVESCTAGFAATSEAQLGWGAQGDTVLRALAAVYADHSDYRSEWAA